MPADDIAPCSRCGAPTAIRFDGLPVCEDCYTALASCCAGDEAYRDGEAAEGHEQK